MPRSPSFLLTCVIALVLAGCDRQSAEPAQPQEEQAAQNEGGLTGTLDRSFAGQALPTTQLVDPSGATLAMADLKGKPALVNLWATWCVPCVTEMPMLNDLAGELGDSVRVVTVSQDMKGAEVVEPFFAQRKLANLPKWIDAKNDLPFAYGGGSALPLTVLYGADGKEIWRVMGGFDWSSAEARELVAEATAGKG
ncbi:MAG: TlpA family protein disulfide reductase [Porphyrobacter sp.]|nr:TlpA family protein disulfide reductase [Porphyrobacter sp.]